MRLYVKFFFVFKHFLFAFFALNCDVRAITLNATSRFITRQIPTTSQAAVCFRFFWLRINNIATILQNRFLYFILFI